MRCDLQLVSNETMRVMLAMIIGCGLIGLNPRARAAAAESDMAESLKLIPKEALGAVVFNRFDNVNRPIVNVMDDRGMIMMALHIFLMNLLHNHDGVNEKGVALFMVLPPITANSPYPFATFAIPFTDYDKYFSKFYIEDLGAGFSRIVGERSRQIRVKPEDAALPCDIWLAKQGNYALIMCQYSPVRETDEMQQEMRTRAKKLLIDRQPEMPAQIASFKDWLERQDICVFLTAAGVKQCASLAQSKIKQIKATSEQTANLPARPDMNQTEMLHQQLKMATQALSFYDTVFAWLGSEVSQLALGVTIDDDHTLRLATRSTFVNGSAWKESVEKLPAPSNAPFSDLPGGPFIAAFGGAFLGNGSHYLTNYSLQIMKVAAAGGAESKVTDDDWKRIGEVMNKTLDGVRSMSVVVNVPIPGQSLYGATVGVVKVEDSAKYLNNYSRAIAAFGEIANASNYSFLGKYEVKTTEFDGSPLLEVKSDFSDLISHLKKQRGGGEAAEKYFETVFGTDGKINVGIQPFDNQTVILSWGGMASLERAKQALNSPTESLACEASVKSTMALLPKGSRWMGLVSPSGALTFVQTILQSLGSNSIAVPDFGNVPPVGFGARPDGDALETELVIPGATVKAVDKLFPAAKTRE